MRQERKAPALYVQDVAIPSSGGSSVGARVLFRGGGECMDLTDDNSDTLLDEAPRHPQPKQFGITFDSWHAPTAQFPQWADTLVKPASNAILAHTQPQQWLSSDHIFNLGHAIIELYKPKLQSSGITVRQYEPMDRKKLFEHFRKRTTFLCEADTQCNVLFIPLCDDHHWTIVIIDGRKPARHIYWFCPLGDKINDALFAELQRFYPSFSFANVKQNTTTEGVQDTDFDCGIWIMVILTRFLVFLIGYFNALQSDVAPPDFQQQQQFKSAKTVVPIFTLKAYSRNDFFVFERITMAQKAVNRRFAEKVRASYTEKLRELAAKGTLLTLRFTNHDAMKQ